MLNFAYKREWGILKKQGDYKSNTPFEVTEVNYFNLLLLYI